MSNHSFPSILTFDRPLVDKFTVTALSLALFEIQAVYKAVTEIQQILRFLSDSSLIVPRDHLVTVS